jgi:5-methylthioribose kinase
MGSYIVDFCIGCYKGDFTSGIGYRLIKNSNPLYDIWHTWHKQASNNSHTSKQTNLNALLNHTLQNTFKVFHMLCASCLSDSSTQNLNSLLYRRHKKSLDWHLSTIIKLLFHQANPKFKRRSGLSGQTYSFLITSTAPVAIQVSVNYLLNVWE